MLKSMSYKQKNWNTAVFEGLLINFSPQNVPRIAKIVYFCIIRQKRHQ